jgi:hypothetical protein
MWRDSENEGGPLINVWVRFNIGRIFHGFHSLVSRLGI